jgi:CRP-like cAMP-binding protein
MVKKGVVMVENCKITDDDLKRLFDFLDGFRDMPYLDFKSHVAKQLVCRYCKKQEVLHWVGRISKKAWFIKKGMVMMYVNGKDGKVVVGFFKAGEIAVLPDSFKSEAISVYGLIAVAETELMEISKFQMNLIYELFPKSTDLEGRIFGSVTVKLALRAILINLPAQERVDKFHDTYPDTKGKNRTVKLLDKDKANYLNIGETYFSRFCADDREEDLF